MLREKYLEVDKYLERGACVAKRDATKGAPSQANLTMPTIHAAKTKPASFTYCRSAEGAATGSIAPREYHDFELPSCHAGIRTLRKDVDVVSRSGCNGG